MALRPHVVVSTSLLVLLSAAGTEAQAECQRQTNSAFAINIPQDAIPNSADLYSFSSDSIGGYAAVQQVWQGSEADCCAACCTFPACTGAVYWEDGTCGLMTFDISPSQGFPAVVLTGCVLPPSPSPEPSPSNPPEKVLPPVSIPSPDLPSPEPVPEPSPEPAPEPSPEPAPEPSPEPAPEPSPSTSPAPKPAPEPSPAESPAPEPVPAPQEPSPSPSGTSPPDTVTPDEPTAPRTPASPQLSVPPVAAPVPPGGAPVTGQPVGAPAPATSPSGGPNQTTLSLTEGAATSTQTTGGGGNSAGIIVGVVAGGIVLLVASLFALFLVRKRREKYSMTDAKTSKGAVRLSSTYDLGYSKTYAHAHKSSSHVVPVAGAAYSTGAFSSNASLARNSDTFESAPIVPAGAVKSAYASRGDANPPSDSAYSEASAAAVSIAMSKPSDTLAALTETRIGVTTASDPRYTPEGVHPIHFLTHQLDILHRQGRPLRNRYNLLSSSEQRSGSQGVVRFATLATNPTRQFAIKFYLDAHSFEVERALYVDKSLHSVLTPTDDVCPNRDEPPVLGRPLPPMIVTERGESLDEWTARFKPDFWMSLAIVGHLAQRVEKIHSAGLVHRDLKPGNVMWLPSVNGFTVIDFGSAARSMAEARISCTLTYAAPEAVHALHAGETHMVAQPSLDVWSLGIIFYEFLTGTRVFGAANREQIFTVLCSGDEAANKLPWESKAHSEEMRRLGFLRDTVLSMLVRDPAKRISMAAVNAQLNSLIQREQSPSFVGMPKPPA